MTAKVKFRAKAEGRLTVTEPVAEPRVTMAEAVAVVRGPRGFVGPEGPPGHVQWAGNGPALVIPGASPGQTYLDLDTGDIYRLQ